MRWLRWLRRLRAMAGVDERGALTVWMVGLTSIGAILFAGLVYDAGNAANLQSEITDTAWSIARAATAQVEISGTGGWLIDEARAQEAAAHIADSRPDVDWVLEVDGDEVTVVVSTVYKTRILKSIGITEWQVKAERTAAASSN